MARLPFYILTLCLYAVLSGVPALAQDSIGSIERKLELAKSMQDIRPAKEQVDKAIGLYLSSVSEDQRGAYAAALQQVLNYKALEQVSIDAYAEVFTEAELEAMVDYFSKPEAKSASDKISQYAGKIYPEITRMLDQAAIKAKTGGK